MRGEIIVASFNVLFQHLPGGTEETFGVVGFRTENGTQNQKKCDNSKGLSTKYIKQYREDFYIRFG
jgi:hypothetical protein